MRKTGMPEWMIRIYLDLFAIGQGRLCLGRRADVAQVLNRRAIGFDEFLRGHLHPFGEASGGAAAR